MKHPFLWKCSQKNRLEKQGDLRQGMREGLTLGLYCSPHDFADGIASRVRYWATACLVIFSSKAMTESGTVPNLRMISRLQTLLTLRGFACFSTRDLFAI